MTAAAYCEDFETTDPVTFWSAKGEYEVHFAGLSTERSHRGRQSYKLDITFLRDSINSFWSGPILDLPAVPGTRFSGHIYLERVPENVEVSLGIGFHVPALTALGSDDGRGSRMMLGSFNARSQTGCWHRQTSDVHVAAEGMSRKLVGEVTPGLRLEKWHINIQCREAVDARLVIYIDDILLEGGSLADDWEAREEQRLREWVTARQAQVRERADRFRHAIAPIHAEALRLVDELDQLALPAGVGGVWQAFAVDALRQARELSAELVTRADPDGEAPAEDKAFEVRLHDLRDRYMRPLRWARDSLPGICDHQRPYLLTVTNNPISNHRILPASRLLAGTVDGTLDLFASPGEHVPASIVVVPTTATVVTVSTSDLRGDGAAIGSEQLDWKLVKVWYQAGIELSEVGDRVLTPELLLNDDDLVQVDTGRQQNTVRDIDHPRDAPQLLPVAVDAGAAQQLWLTVRVPPDATPGTYHGRVAVHLEGLGEHDLPIHLEVLPVTLGEADLHYGIYYRGVLSASASPTHVSSELKTEAQLAAEFGNLRDHGIRYPDVYQSVGRRADGSLDVDDLERYLDIRDRAGLPRDKLFYNGRSVGAPASEVALDELVDFCRQLIEWARGRGFEEVYFFGSDEAFGEELAGQRRAWERVRELGGRMTVACSTGFFDLVGDLLDLPIVARMSPQDVPRVHALGHRICNYSMPQGGLEQPFLYRYFFGHWLRRSGMDGSRTYAYQHAFGAGDSMGRPWDDFDNALYRSHMLAYPTVDGVVDTLQWEGVRAAVDDMRYTATLHRAIAAAVASGSADLVERARSAEDWLAQLDILGDLQAVRRQMAERIVDLQRATAAAGEA